MRVCVRACKCACVSVSVCVIYIYIYIYISLTQVSQSLEGNGLQLLSAVLRHCFVTPTLHLLCHGTRQLQHLLYIPVRQ